LHGRGELLFRTFHNVANGVNLQIHTFLLTLEHIIEKEGELPGTNVVLYVLVYHQCHT
jgi:hypothetical protein